MAQGLWFLLPNNRMNRDGQLRSRSNSEIPNEFEKADIAKGTNFPERHRARLATPGDQERYEDATKHWRKYAGLIAKTPKEGHLVNMFFKRSTDVEKFENDMKQRLKDRDRNSAEPASKDRRLPFDQPSEEEDEPPCDQEEQETKEHHDGTTINPSQRNTLDSPQRETPREPIEEACYDTVTDEERVREEKPVSTDADNTICDQGNAQTKEAYAQLSETTMVSKEEKKQGKIKTAGVDEHSLEPKETSEAREALKTK